MQPSFANLSNEPLLKQAPVIKIDGRDCPSLGGVALINKLGEGTTGATFVGLNPQDGQLVCVKVSPTFPDVAQERSMRLIIDAKGALDVKSPYLVNLYSFGTEAGVFFQVQELVAGDSAQLLLNKIRERLKPGLDEPVVLDLAAALAEGIAAGHRINVMHRNLRPSSILVPRNAAGDGHDFARAKVADLGLAYNEASAKMLEGTPAITGIPGIMSPEQATGEQELTPASDVFSIGATLYTLLVGQPPFGGFNLNLVLSATIINEAGDLRTWRPDVSRALARVIALCLKKNPKERFADAGVLLNALNICRMALGRPLETQVASISSIDALVAPVQAPAEQEQIVIPSAPIATPVPEPQPAAVEQEISAAVTPEIAAAKTNASAPAVQPKKQDILEDALRSTPAKSGYQDAPTLVPPKKDPYEGAFAASAFLPSVHEAGRKPETTLFNDLLGKKNSGTVPTVQPPAPPSQSAASAPRVASAPPPPPPPPPPEPEKKDGDWEVMVSHRAEEQPRTTLVAESSPPNKYSASQEWDDPTKTADVADETPPPRRGIAGVLALVALLLIVCGAGAWYLNLIPPKVLAMVGLKAAEKKNPAPPVDPLPPDTSKPPLPPPLSPEEQAKVDAEAAKRKLELEEEQKRKDEAKKKADEEYRLAEERAKELKAREAEAAKIDAELKAQAEAKAKSEAEARAKALAEAKAKAEAEARAKAEEERIKAEELEKLRIAEEQKTQAARLKAEAEAKAKEKAIAEAKAKAEAEEKARLDAAKAEEKRLAEERARAEREKNEKKPPNKAESIAIANLPREISVDLGDSVKIEFVLVPAGTFMMGMDQEPLQKLADGEGGTEESPAHKVAVLPFYIGKTPVTVAQFRRFIAATEYKTSAERYGEAYTLAEGTWKRTPGASWQRPGFRQDDDHPVVMLSLRDSEAFAQWLSGQSGRIVRLPTEEEWEFAARGPQNNVFPWGEKWDHALANHADTKLKAVCNEKLAFSKWNDGFAFTSPVGAFNNRSWCGAYDMAGNVLQWCSTPYEKYPSTPNAPRIVVDPEDAPDAKRALRGGSYLFRPIDLRSSARRNLSPRAWSCELGMRMAFTPQP